ncbi:MAG: DUF3987 domain-containing protein [Gammaproteobacteria bacterium]|nr:DUF3987 domain-containing protein [Gammaproteobacteria bacterium]
MSIITTAQAKKAANEFPAIKNLLHKGWHKTGFYEYQDETGNPFYWRIRLDPSSSSKESKWIRPFSYNGKDWALKEPYFEQGKKLLYSLPIIKNATSNIYIVEGEKCADALVKCGVLATTSGSAASATDADWGLLTSKHVIIWPDNDDAGFKYAQAVTEQLLKINCSVQWIDVEQLNLQPKDDCVDWLAANPNTTKQEIESLPLISKSQEPIPLIPENEQSALYPVELLPELAKKAVEAYQEYGKQPLSMIVTSTLASMSLACQGLANVERDKQLISPISLYFIIVAESGERKTAADNFFSNSNRIWESNKSDELEIKIKEAEAKSKAHAAKKEGLIAEIKKAAAKGSSTFKSENNLRELELNEPEKVITPKLFHEEATPEALAFSLAHGWQSSSLWSDEAGIVIGGQGMNQDNILKAITLLNRLWDGNTYSVDRKTSDNFKIEGRRFTCSLMMQQAVFEQFTSKCSGISRGSGFLSRCLLIMPKSTMGSRFYQEPTSIADAEPFKGRILELLDTPFSLDEKSRLTPKALQLTPEAKASWIEFHDDIEQQLKIGGEYENMQDFASKAAENVARLAGIFHVFEDKVENQINRDTLKRAAGIITWHLREINRIIKKQSMPPEMQDAQLLADWIIAQNIKKYKIADLLRFGPNSLREKTKRDKSLAILAEHNYLNIIDKEFISNPNLWSKDDFKK